MEARKRWRAIIERSGNTEFTRGEEYVRLWKEGIRPDYSPALSAPAETVPEPEIEPVDFMNVQAKVL